MQRRGHYVISAHGRAQGVDGFGPAKWSRPLAVNGPVADSDLTSVQKVRIKLPEDENYKLGWTNRLGAEGLDDGVSGQNEWKLWMIAVLALLLIEVLILSWGALSGMLTSASDADSDGSPATEGA